MWAGKRALFGADEETLPEFLSPPGGVTWLKTAWADYHTLGRWMMLERLKPLLSAQESAANPRSRAELRRAVEIAMQQLAP